MIHDSTVTGSAHSDRDEMRLRTSSKRLFGRAHRLAISLALAERDLSTVFCVDEIAKELDLANSVVHGEVSVLTDAGIVERLPAQPETRVVYFRRASSAYWEFVRALAEHAQAPPPMPSAGRGTALAPDAADEMTK
jgi:DNA-binding transcriptional ArsR family regulator